MGSSYSFLDPLQPFDPNKSLASQMTVARMNAWLSWCRENQLVNGVGTLLSRVGGGVAVNARKQRGGASPLKGALQPGSDFSTNSAPRFTITYGTYGGQVPTIGGVPLDPSVDLNIITLGATDRAVYMQCDFTYDTVTGIFTIVDVEIMSTSGSIPTSTISSGSGTLYQELFGVSITAPVGSGPYAVIAAPGVGGSQNFAVCLSGPSISGPWGV